MNRGMDGDEEGLDLPQPQSLSLSGLDGALPSLASSANQTTLSSSAMAQPTLAASATSPPQPAAPASPLIEISKVQLQFSLSQATFTAAAVQNNILILALSSRRLLRIDLERGEDVDDVDLPLSSSGGDSSAVIRRLFLDPGGTHLLVAVDKPASNKSGEGRTSEVYYLHAQSRAPRPLPRLKGVRLMSVGWSPYRPTTSTREILVGDRQGNLYEVVIDGGSSSSSGWHAPGLKSSAGGGGEKMVKHVWKVPPWSSSSTSSSSSAGGGSGARFSGGVDAIVGIWVDLLPDDTAQQPREPRRRVVVATPDRMFHFVGRTGRTANDGGTGSIYTKLFETEAPTIYETAPISTAETSSAEKRRSSVTKSRDNTASAYAGFATMVVSPDVQDETGFAPGQTSPTADHHGEESDRERWFAWLSAHQEILHGKLVPGLDAASSDSSKTRPSGVITTGSSTLGSAVFNSAQVLARSAITGASTASATPRRRPPPASSKSSSDHIQALVLSHWHMLCLVQGRIMAVRLLDNQVVFDQLVLDSGESAIGVLADQEKSTFWLFTPNDIFEIVLTDEDRDVWQVMLAQGQFSLASQYAKTPAQKDAVAVASGDHLISKRRFLDAAAVYGKSSRPFEQVALTFIDHGEQDALRKYLLTKLKTYKKSALMQRTMIACWLVEIYMTKLNSLDDTLTTKAQLVVDGATAADETEGELAKVRDEFKAFVMTSKTDLDKQTVYEVISSHGREQELLLYATVIDDYNYVLSYWVQREKWDESLAVLGRQTDASIFYNYSTVLMAHVAPQLVDVLTRHDELDPVKLIPALLNYTGQAATAALPIAQNQAVRYLNWCINSGIVLANPAAIHNTLVSILAAHPSPSEAPLLSYLSTHSPLMSSSKFEKNTPPYDADFAFRLCIQHHRVQSAVHIYSSMGDYSSAVLLALKHDEIDLASMVADRPPDTDVALRKKLWLEVAKRVIQQQSQTVDPALATKPGGTGKGKGTTTSGRSSTTIKTALDFLKRCPLLRIEDLIPFFPDFVVIDSFKEEICSALEEYSRGIAQLDADMDAATLTAESLKRDIAALDKRYALVEPYERCRVCSLPLLSRQFYVFPSCQHGFHSDCLGRRVVERSGVVVQRRVRELQANLAVAAAAAAAGQAGVKREREARELDDVIGAECILCGDLAIRGIDMPFITPADDVHEWDV